MPQVDQLLDERRQAQTVNSSLDEHLALRADLPA
jgi:hypothetical protein